MNRGPINHKPLKKMEKIKPVQTVNLYNPFLRTFAQKAANSGRLRVCMSNAFQESTRPTCPSISLWVYVYIVYLGLPLFHYSYACMHASEEGTDRCGWHSVHMSHSSLFLWWYVILVYSWMFEITFGQTIRMILRRHLSLKLTFRQYPAKHTYCIISHCTTLQYNHNIWHGRPY